MNGQRHATSPFTDYKVSAHRSEVNAKSAQFLVCPFMKGFKRKTPRRHKFPAYIPPRLALFKNSNSLAMCFAPLISKSCQNMRSFKTSAPDRQQTCRSTVPINYRSENSVKHIDGATIYNKAMKSHYCATKKRFINCFSTIISYFAKKDKDSAELFFSIVFFYFFITVLTHIFSKNRSAQSVFTCFSACLMFHMKLVRPTECFT